MPYARINMNAGEFTSHEERRRSIATLRNDIKSVFPEIRAFVSVDLGGGSGLTISVYDDVEAADRAMSNRSKHLENRGIKDVFHHAGEVDCFYIEEEQLGHLLKSGS